MLNIWFDGLTIKNSILRVALLQSALTIQRDTEPLFCPLFVRSVSRGYTEIW